MVVKTGDFAQSIVSAAMGVAGEVIQRFELAEDGDIDRGAEGLLQFVESGDLVAQQKRAQFMGVEGEGPHNVIVPTATVPPDRNYNKLRIRSLPLSEGPQMAIPTGYKAITSFSRRPAGKGRL